MSKLIYSRNPDGITHLVGEGNYTFVYYKNAKPLLVAMTMHTCLGALPGLIRIHKRYAVNPHFLQPVDRGSSEVQVTDKRLPISRRRHKGVIKQLSALGITA